MPRRAVDIFCLRQSNGTCQAAKSRLCAQAATVRVSGRIFSEVRGDSARASSATATWPLDFRNPQKRHSHYYEDKESDCCLEAPQIATTTISVNSNRLETQITFSRKREGNCLASQSVETHYVSAIRVKNSGNLISESIEGSI